MTKRIIFTTILTGMLSAAYAGNILLSQQKARLLSSHRTLVYDRPLTADGRTRLQMHNVEGGGFVLTRGTELLGYSTTGTFDPQTAPPALLELLEAHPQKTMEAPSGTVGGTFAPLLSTQWNQDAPYNDQCPMYDMTTRCPTGCVATAMAQVMAFHRWPLQGIGSHSYQPAVLAGNTLGADFGSTTYLWDAMLPNYATATTPAEGYSMQQCREAVATLMLHCGISVDMVYYTQSGATDYDVPRALVDYFAYDPSLAYRKREHYGTRDWLQTIAQELAEGRPVLAYGRASAGGHAYVFDGMDDDGFIHVNWGWGGMSDGYFNTSALTPASQGIGGSDGGFNYSQRIITGIRPADGMERDRDVELTSTEGLKAGRQRVEQNADIAIRLSGKVINHGWQDATFDYALLLLTAEGDTVRVMAGPTGQTLAKDATDYAPTFGTVSLGTLQPGSYVLYPACRMTGGTGPWLRIRDNYIGYANRLDITATDTQIRFSQPDYFALKATDTEVHSMDGASQPATIYSGMPALVTTTVTNEGDVEYHGEVKAQLRQGNTVAASTANYLVDLQPGESTQLRFTDAFSAEAGDYTLCLVDDDGTVISARIAVNVKEAPAAPTIVAAEPLSISSKGTTVTATAKVTTLPSLGERLRVGATAGMGLGEGLGEGFLLYTFLYSSDGKTQMGSLFPEYVLLNGSQSTAEVTMAGTMENGVPGTIYQARLAVYDGAGYTFLDEENATTTFRFGEGTDGIALPTQGAAATRTYDLQGRPATAKKGLTITNGRKTIK